MWVRLCRIQGPDPAPRDTVRSFVECLCPYAGKTYCHLHLDLCSDSGSGLRRLTILFRQAGPLYLVITRLIKKLSSTKKSFEVKREG